eukprot:CAMPEP_0197590036 /NCGR_PEP_ID=MMETSP1326-20131121/10771_1 /TAXON_ID=1155430 /ORGANISM="Genus nov. species nov., Strain RCC2288" /LENGTH=261 /DNA_ID=CAMNT_0043155031 /DNA_START=46 /DNA_END=827 /DNA_ORIENTATION=-
MEAACISWASAVAAAPLRAAAPRAHQVPSSSNNGTSYATARTSSARTGGGGSSGSINSGSRKLFVPRSVISPLPRRGGVLRAWGNNKRAAQQSDEEEEEAAAPKKKDETEELDFVTRMVMNVFGKDALDDPEPMGLKRMNAEEWPDQWPALVDEYAEPLETDDTEELVSVRAVLKQTQLENMPLGLAYDADVHGWRSSSFHTQLDGQGAALLVAISADGTVFGGYNPKGWLGYGEWLDAISAFLYVFPKQQVTGPFGGGGV